MKREQRENRVFGPGGTMEYYLRRESFIGDWKRPPLFAIYKEKKKMREYEK